MIQTDLYYQIWKEEYNKIQKTTQISDKLLYEYYNSGMTPEQTWNEINYLPF